MQLTVSIPLLQIAWLCGCTKFATACGRSKVRDAPKSSLPQLHAGGMMLQHAYATPHVYPTAGTLTTPATCGMRNRGNLQKSAGDLLHLLGSVSTVDAHNVCAGSSQNNAASFPRTVFLLHQGASRHGPFHQGSRHSDQHVCSRKASCSKLHVMLQARV